MNTPDTDMFQEMREAGSKLPDMVEALQLAGWKTYQHHDNWVCANFPHGMDTHKAYNTLSAVEKMRPEQNRFNKRLDDSFKNNPVE